MDTHLKQEQSIVVPEPAHRPGDQLPQKSLLTAREISILDSCATVGIVEFYLKQEHKGAR